MANVRYKAMTSAGAIVSGTVEAPTEQDAVRKLREDGLYPISAKVGSAFDLGGLLRGAGQWASASPLRLLTVATQELAALLQAGLDIDRALGIVANLRDVGIVGRAFANARAKVRDGAPLAQALAKEPAFPKFYIGMVRAGELGGTLAQTLQRLADYLRKSLAVREAIISALVYPIILLITAGASISIILVFVLPEFEPLFADAGKSLPLPTQVVMAVSKGFRLFWWVGVLAAVGGWLWLKRALGKPEFRKKFDAWLLRLPLIGTLLIDTEVEKFNRSLGTLLNAGVALPTALLLSHDILWNREIAAVVKAAATGLREGERLAGRLAKSPFFPRTALDLMQIGEETGKLGEMLLRQADLSEQHIRYRVDRLIAMLVPGLTILLGIVIAGLIASMLIAILSINDLAV